MECKIQKIRLKKIFFIKIRLTDCRMESGSRSIGGRVVVWKMRRLFFQCSEWRIIKKGHHRAPHLVNLKSITVKNMLQMYRLILKRSKT